jgi:hypothetical protein
MGKRKEKELGLAMSGHAYWAGGVFLLSSLGFQRFRNVLVLLVEVGRRNRG